jgi:bacillithiol biosynthesis deacetylase BshB1
VKVDLLVLAAHPDDAELGCGGTIARHVVMGYKVGIVDFTQGEMGTRGSVETRKEESREASRILGLSVRENLHLRDGFFTNGESDQLKVIRAIRAYQPSVILANAVRDRHSDHGRAATLADDACFLAGLSKIETVDDFGKPQLPWRPRALYHYIQSNLILPDLVVDVTDYWKTKMDSILAYKSQFHDPNSQEPETFISSPTFLKRIESRAIDFGYTIGVTYGEGFTVKRFPGVTNLMDLL